MRTTQLTLAADPSKEAEVAHFQQFVADLPAGSYLANILQDMPGEVEYMIRSDFGYPLSLHDARGARCEAWEAVAEERKQVEELSRKAKLQTAIANKAILAASHAKRDLEHVREAAQDLCRVGR